MDSDIQEIIKEAKADRELVERLNCSLCWCYIEYTHKADCGRDGWKMLLPCSILVRADDFSLIVATTSCIKNLGYLLVAY